MKSTLLKVARIGNSRGVRIPATVLARYRIGDSVMMEELTDGIFLRPRRAAGPRLSWDETARAMAASTENWGAWDITLADGMDQVPWEAPPVRRVAERRETYVARKKSRAK